MTGFGQGTADRDGVRAVVELKGVNHRYLEVRMRLPAEMSLLEARLRSQVQGQVARGRIDMVVLLTSSRPVPLAVQVNRDLVAAYMRAAASLKKEFGVKGSVGLESLLAIPGAITVQGDATRSDGAEADLVCEALRGALTEYNDGRTAEAGRLVDDLKNRLATIRAAAGRIEQEAAALPAHYAHRIRERLAALLQGEHALDTGRLEQEVALLAGRVDVTEELVRLRGYLDQSSAVLERPQGPVGKTLDFIMQEMNREANTISSKAEAPTVCGEALRIKAEVEKIREQVQNLE